MSLVPSGIFGGYWGGYGGIARADAPPADPEAKAKPSDPLPRDGWAGTLGSPFARWPGWDKAPPGGDYLWLAMLPYSAIVLALGAIITPILGGTRTLEIRKDDGTAATAEDARPPVGDGVKADPLDKIKAAMERHFDPLWTDILTGLEFVHWGRWTQEVIWDRVDGLTLPVRFKDWRPWEVSYLVDKFGDFAGVRQNFGTAGTKDGNERDARYVLHNVHLPHRNAVYGWPRAENARADWWRAQNNADNADRAERKASGISFLFQYDPLYQFKNAAGTVISAEAQIQQMFNGMASGGAAAGPLYTFTRGTIEAKPELADASPIKVTPLNWGDTGPAITAALARLDGLDKRIVRAYGRPEREMLEGQFGTKAESEVQGDLGVLDSEAVHNTIVRQFNAQTWQTLLATNFGPAVRGRLFWKAAQLTKADKAWKQTLAQTLAALPAGDEMNDLVDRRALGKETELALLSKEEVKRRIDQAKADQQQQMAQRQAADAQAAAQAAAVNGGNGQPAANGNGRITVG